MAEDFVIIVISDRDNISRRKRDGTGEVMYFNDKDAAVVFAMDYQDDDRCGTYFVLSAAEARERDID